MKFKQILYILLVLVLFFGLDRSVGYVCKAIVGSSQMRFSKVYAGESDFDVLVMGNSRAVNGFYVPEVVSLSQESVLNLGYNGMSMEINEAMLLDYLEKNKKPKMLILEVTNLHSKNNLIKDLKQYAPFSSMLRKLQKRDDTFQYNLSKVIHTYSFNSELFLRTLYYSKKSDQSWINDGKSTSLILDQSSNNEVYSVGEISENNLNSLRNIMSLCDRTNIKLKLVVSPYWKLFVSNNSDFENYLSVVKSLSVGGVEFYDYSLAISSPEYFADPIHINKQGAINLAKIMHADGIFDCSD